MGTRNARFGDVNSRAALMAAFGENVRKRRKELGFTQEELARQAGLHRTYVADVERGNRNPSLETVALLARGLGLTPAKLCEGIDSKR